MNKLNKILVIGGLHGDETLGIELVNLLRNNPIEGVDGIFGNPAATAVNSRYIDKDLNRVFPGRIDGCLEEIRAVQIMAIAKDYDFILDIHNTTSPDNDCGFVGGNYKSEAIKVSQVLGLNNVVDATYDCINKYLPNCLSVEVSFDSKLCNSQYWYNKIVELSKADLDAIGVDKINLYQYYGRVSGEKYKELGLKFQNFNQLTGKDKINLDIASELEISSIFVNPQLFLGVYCTLVKSIPNPY